MKLIILIFNLLLITLNGFSQNSIKRDLKRAYNDNSVEQLEQILNKWCNSIKSNNSEYSNNDTIRNIYEIFAEFYTPQNLRRIGLCQWSDTIYQRSKYFIIQNSIKYGITKSKIYLDTVQNQIDTANRILSEMYYGELFGTISNIFSETKTSLFKNFRPEFNSENVKALYITDKYSRDLNSFLGRRYSRIFKKVIRYDEPFKRREFLANRIVIFWQHWDKYWHLETHPYIYTIIMDEKMENAIIDFRLVFQGGNAYLKKIDNKWILISSGLIWIE